MIAHKLLLHSLRNATKLHGMQVDRQKEVSRLLCPSAPICGIAPLLIMFLTAVLLLRLKLDDDSASPF